MYLYIYIHNEILGQVSGNIREGVLDDFLHASLLT